MSKIQGSWRGYNIVKDGLVLYLDASSPNSYSRYGFDSSLWKDISGNSYNGTFTNSPVFNSANGGSISFNGVNSYIDNIGLNSSFDFIFSEGNLSVGFWLKLSSTNNRYAILGNTATNTEKGFVVIVEYGISGFGDNCLRFGVSGNSANTRLIAGSTDDNVTNTGWNHYFYTCQNPDKVGQWYINGIPVNTTTRVGSGNANQGDYYSGPATRTLNVGRTNFSSTIIPLNGNLGNLMIYNRAITSSEVLNTYNETKSRFN